jgi:hypothetical protein
MEDLSPSSHNVDVPHVSRTDYTLLDITDDGFVSLMTEGGDTKDDLQLPSGTDEADKLAIQIKADFDAGKELMVSVMKVGVRPSTMHNTRSSCPAALPRQPPAPPGCEDQPSTIKC